MPDTPGLPVSPGLRPGLAAALADRYTIERELGRGGNATVYLAHDPKHDRKVAVKVLLPELAQSVRAERFLREIQIAAKLTHPHILPVHDSGAAEGILYYVMPYVAGESLRDRLQRERQLPLADALQIAREVADALSYAHEQNVVHRDIKPENILLQAGHAVVADFGIARALSEASGQTVTQTGIAVGTPVYMSPEQAGGSKTLDARSDVYSLGCVLYEMLAGQPPFTGESPQEILAHHALDPVPRLRKVRPEVPAAVEDLILHALAKRPGERFATAAEFTAALNGQADLRRRRWPPRRAALVAASLAVLIAGGWFAAQRAPSGRVHDAAWARGVGILQVRRLAEEGNWDSAWTIARAAATLIPDDSTLGTVWPEIARRVTIETDPPDAKVYRTDYSAHGEADYLGTTPLQATWMPYGMSRLRFEKDGHETVEVGFIPAGRDAVLIQEPAGVGTNSPSLDEGRRVRIKLFRQAELPSGMVAVPGGGFRIGTSGLQHLPPIQLSDYFIDKYEVTNRQYKQFVAAGGYRDRTYWLDPFLKEGHAVRWDDGVARFVDRTGRPGPATWEAGDYLDGQEEYPVAGLSWYEAAAYARFAGKALPTVYHWTKAAGSGAAAPWIVPPSNFGGQGPARVGTHADMSLGGAYDMAGNMREWCLNRSGEERYILGGGWNDETYMFALGVTESPWDRSPANGIRLVSYPDTSHLTLASQPIQVLRRDFSREQPAGDAAFAIYRRVFDYDPLPLEAAVEETDSADARWIRQRVSFAAAYGHERVPAIVFLPRAVPPPYQTVMFFPGGNAMRSLSSKDLPSVPVFDFVVKSGRAVIYPIYKSTYERGDEVKSTIGNESNAYREHFIMWAKDLRRAVDYAATRRDLDVRRLAYLGASWGANVGPIMLVAEPRITVAVLNLGGLKSQRVQPEVEPFHYVSRVTVPVLLLSGRYDPLNALDQSALPFFRLLGTPPDKKRQVITEGGHFTPRPILIRETLDWLDRYLGPVRR